MIYTMLQDIETALQDRLFPVHIFYGPEAMQRQEFTNAIVGERTRGTDEAVLPMLSFQRNPRAGRVRALAVSLRIYVRSSKVGARVNEHEAECDQIVDALVDAITEWGVTTKAGLIEFSESTYIDAGEFNEVEQWPGVAYSLKFAVPRAVTRKNYVGAGKPTGSAASVVTTDQITVDNTGTPESAC